jgi:hypothetical protein
MTAAAEDVLAEFKEHHSTTIELLKIEDLSIDPVVQRMLDPKWVSMRKNKFRPDGLGVFEVSRRASGMIHVIDGQHRRALCQEVSYPGPVTCQVYEGLTTADEAFLFQLLNDRKGVPAIDTFNMRVQSGDPVAVELNDVLQKYDWVVRASTSPFSFRAVSALERIYRGWGVLGTTHLGICEAIVSIVTAAWEGDPKGMKAEIISGIGLVIMRHGPEVKVDKLVTQLRNWVGGPEVLSLQARAFKEASGGRLDDAMATKIVNMLNTQIPRKSKNRLPDWGSE